VVRFTFYITPISKVRRKYGKRDFAGIVPLKGNTCITTHAIRNANSNSG